MMDWTQSLTIIISVFGLFLVAIPYLISKLEANQKENNGKFDAMNIRFNSLENRLTALEAETKFELRNINQRLSNIEIESKDVSKRLSSIDSYLSPKKVFHFEEHHRDDEEPKEN
jgi:hypothetical protein